VVVTVVPEDQKVAQNGIANFYCKAAGGATAPDLHWFKSGQRIGRNHKRYLIVDSDDSGGGVALRIEPVRARRDEGTYECRPADSGAAGTPAVARLHVYPDEQSGQNILHTLHYTAPCPDPTPPRLFLS